MNTSQILDDLYRRIPRTWPGCVPGCTLCCGPVPFCPEEQRRIGKPECFHRSMARLRFDGSCIFAGSEGCTIYPNRPFTCRLYGHVLKMTCPMGGMPDPEWIQGEEWKLMQAYYTLFVPEDIEWMIRQTEAIKRWERKRGIAPCTTS